MLSITWNTPKAVKHPESQELIRPSESGIYSDSTNLKKLQAESTKPEELTAANLDKSNLLENLIQRSYGSQAEDLVGELQVRLPSSYCQSFQAQGITEGRQHSFHFDRYCKAWHMVPACKFVVRRPQLLSVKQELQVHSCETDMNYSYGLQHFLLPTLYQQE